jgi:glycosyltransferase involved in cell wall biosynthesis
VRVLLVNQFYPPDMAPTGQHLHDLAVCLVGKGHEVEVVCSRRSYDGGGEYAAEEVIGGVRVKRVSTFAFGRRGAGRAVDYASFLLAAAGRAVVDRRRYDLTLCLTTPPYVGWAVPLALGRRGGAIAQWVMDLYPDVLTAHGSIRSGGVVNGALVRLTRAQLGCSSLVLALGSHARERVRSHATMGVPVEAVPLWAPFEGPPSAEVVRSWRETRGWKPDDLVFLYSGNMGLGHRMGEFLRASSRLRGDRAIWAFAGSGRRREEVEQFIAAHPEARTQLFPYVSQQELAASLAAADVHLVSLRSPWQGLIVPSKLQAAFGLSRPVIYVGPRDSEPADWILASGGGWVVDEGDVEGLLRAVGEAASAAERHRRGEAGLAFARVHFDRVTNTARIAELLEEVAHVVQPPEGLIAQESRIQGPP